MKENPMRENRGAILVTSLVTLLPVLAGLLLWNRLPARMPSHFGVSGEVDGTMSKAVMVFAFPAFLLVMHLLAAWLIARDPKKQNISSKLYRLVLWIVPVLSLVLAAVIYPTALGAKVNASQLIFLMEGLLILVCGNYLPKCRPNYTVGIRLPWTLEDEDNWNKTHRMAGPVWVAGGLVQTLMALLPIPTEAAVGVFVGLLVVLILIPSVYSYRLYRKKKEAE